MLNQIPELVVEAGVYMEYKIPESTFYDYKDGATRSLSLTLLHQNTQVRFINLYIRSRSYRLYRNGNFLFSLFVKAKIFSGSCLLLLQLN